MSLLSISLASWAIAVGTYVTVIYLQHGRLFVSDTASLAAWGGVMVSLAVPLLYAPTLKALWAKTQVWWPFPVAGALLGIAPLTMFLALWGTSPLGLFSQGGVVLSCVFGAFGATFGIGYHFARMRLTTRGS